MSCISLQIHMNLSPHSIITSLLILTMHVSIQLFQLFYTFSSLAVQKNGLVGVGYSVMEGDISTG